MIKKITQTLTLVACLGFGVSAQASLIIEGNFSGDFSGSIASLSGSFEAIFDDSVLIGTGSESFTDQYNLTSLTLNPSTIGISTFTTSNVAMNLFFINGVLENTQIGGAPPSTVSVLGSEGDFLVFFDSVQPRFVGIAYTENNEAVFDYADGDSVSGTITISSAVPEPATLALFGIGLAGLGFARKKKKSA